MVYYSSSWWTSMTEQMVYYSSSSCSPKPKQIVYYSSSWCSPTPDGLTTLPTNNIKSVCLSSIKKTNGWFAMNSWISVVGPSDRLSLRTAATREIKNKNSKQQKGISCMRLEYGDAPHLHPGVWRQTRPGYWRPCGIFTLSPSPSKANSAVVQ